ncbi:hypothetical protein P8452_61273 [Trifolium repens]|nr:hypothetical protein P8452_61273 [Trifolium repens]
MMDPQYSYRPPASVYHPSALQVPYQGQCYVAAAAPVQYQQPTIQRPQYQPARPNHWSQTSASTTGLLLKSQRYFLFQNP